MNLNNPNEPRTYPIRIGACLLLCVFWIPACQMSGSQNEKEWVKRTFHDLSYKVPPSWDPIRKEQKIKYKGADIKMSEVVIERFNPGDAHPGVNATIDLSSSIWDLAKLSENAIRNRPGNVKVNLNKQMKFPLLGNKAFLMSVETLNQKAINEKHWVIGAIIGDAYYRITLDAEKYGHYPALDKKFSRFKRNLSISREARTKRKQQGKNQQEK